MKNIHILFFAMFVLLLSENHAQECGSDVKQLPALRGFALGMKEEDLRKILPPTIGRSIPDDNGYGRIDLYMVPKTDGRYASLGSEEGPRAVDTKKFPAFQGADEMVLSLLDDSVFSVWLKYEATVKWKNGPEFVERFAQGMGIPNNFVGDPLQRPGAKPFVFRMQCLGSEFLLDTRDLERPVVKMWNPKIREIIEKRKVDADVRKKKAFKP